MFVDLLFIYLFYFILFTFALLFNKTFSIPIDVYTDNRSLYDIPQMQFQKKDYV